MPKKWANNFTQWVKQRKTPMTLNESYRAYTSYSIKRDAARSKIAKKKMFRCIKFKDSDYWWLRKDRLVGGHKTFRDISKHPTKKACNQEIKKLTKK